MLEVCTHYYDGCGTHYIGYCYYIDGDRGDPHPPTRGDPRHSGGRNNLSKNGLYCDEKVRKTLKSVWKRTRNGTSDTEAGFLVYRDGEGKTNTADLPNTNQLNRYSQDK